MYLRGNLRVRLATQRKSLLASTCDYFPVRLTRALHCCFNVIFALLKRLVYNCFFFCCFQVVVFQHMYWVTLAVVYITVQSTISIFNFGFILWCFLFLWHGQALYLQPRTRLFRLWKIFIGYNYFTLLAKVCLQVSAEQINNKWTKSSFQDYLHCVANFYATVLTRLEIKKNC